MHLHKFSASVAITSLFSLAALAPSAALAVEVAGNVPNGVSVSSDHGRLTSAAPINITLHLKKQDEAAFKKAVDALYDPSSPTFHKWLTDEDLKKYAPAPAQIEAVKKELQSHGLTILSVDPNGFSIRASGSVASVEGAFGTEIHEFERNGQVFRANVKNARLTGAAADYVSSVAGIESHQVQPLARRPVNLKTNRPFPGVALSKVKDAGGLSSILTDQALSAPQSYTFTTPGAALPVGLFYGNVYGVDPTLSVAFTPAQLQAAYGLPAAYAKGLDGTGQTIVLLEAYGYPTLEADANAYFALTGLPLLTPSNFSIVYPQGKPVYPNAGLLTGWDTEIALDIDSAHAIAPKAKIVVVAAAGQSGEDFQAAMQYIINNKIGYQVSDSWEEDTDLLAGPAENDSYETILTLAAAKGISFQFSTGDSGDSGLGTPVGAAGVPSNAPHGTAVGGTTLLNFGSGFRTLGWGDAAVVLASDGPFDPPLAYGLLGGAGGGESLYFPKPSWQKGLPGKGRQTPDVSALADPYTGYPILVTSEGVQQIYVYGGTSLASPIFTAFWALANQNSAKALGQAAPAVAALTAGQLTDVLPYTTPTSVSGSIIDTAGSTSYSIYGLFKGQLYNAVGFTSAAWDLGGGTYFALGFGLDGSLNVTKGWDNTTGYGSPNGLPFLNALAGKK